MSNKNHISNKNIQKPEILNKAASQISIIESSTGKDSNVFESLQIDQTKLKIKKSPATKKTNDRTKLISESEPKIKEVKFEQQQPKDIIQVRQNTIPKIIE